jgi:hypothetical protein
MNIAKLSFDYTKQKRYVIGLMSDIHIDSPGHDKVRFDADMDTLASEGASILFNGDIFDGIFPSDRKRYSRSGDTMAQDAQVNEMVDYAVSRLRPYSDHIYYLGMGNHEVSIVKYNNVDPLAMLQRELNKLRSKQLPPILRGGYTGFVNLHYHRKGEGVKRHLIYRDHGKGGNSPVTKGTIILQRLYTTYDADTVWVGHTHTSIIDNASQWAIGVSTQNKIYKKQKVGIITPGYQRCFEEQDYSDGNFYKLNFPEEKFYSPTGIGYGRLEINLANDCIQAYHSIR